MPTRRQLRAGFAAAATLALAVAAVAGPAAAIDALPFPGAEMDAICCTGTACSVESFYACAAGGGTSYPTGTFFPVGPLITEPGMDEYSYTAPTCTPGMCDTALPPGHGACCGGDLGYEVMEYSLTMGGYGPSAMCVETPSFICFITGGTYTDGARCGAGSCEGDLPATGSCCLPDGSCADLTASDCTGAGGSASGPNSTCALTLCASPEPTGSCCVPGGPCINGATASECLSAGGKFEEGGVCGDDTCECAVGECGDGQECMLGVCVTAEHTGKVFESCTDAGSGAAYLAGQAEEFSARCFHDDTGVEDQYFWTVVDDSSDGAKPNACADKYLEVRPDNTHSGSRPPSVIAPFADYKIQVQMAGTYVLWVRSSKFGGKSDSFFAEIVELREAGVSPLWYRINPRNANFHWKNKGKIEGTNAGGGDTVMLFSFSAPGDYTLRFSNREDGTPVDAWALIKDGAFSPSGCLGSTCPGLCDAPIVTCDTVVVPCETVATTASTDGSCVELVFSDDL